MRTQVLNGIRINYPDKLIYSGDRIVFEVLGVQGTQIVITAVNGQYVDKRETFANAAEVNISQYLQLIFNPKRGEVFSTYKQDVSVSIAIGTTVFYTSFNVIYGKQLLLNKGYKMDFLTRRISTSAPYVYYYALFEPASISISTDAQTWQEIEVSQPIGVHSIDLSAYTSTGCYLKIGNENSTFDYTFDNTFSEGLENIIRFEPNCYRFPYTLVWLNKLGIWQTQTFTQLTENTSVDSLTDINYSNSEFDGLFTSTRSGENSIDLISENLDINNQKRLQSLIVSENVLMYIEGNYYPISVQTKALQITNKENYADIVINCKIQGI